MKSSIITPLLLAAVALTSVNLSAQAEDEPKNVVESTKVPVAATPMPFTATPSTTGSAAMQMPEMPKPTKEHEWLKKFEGEWTYDAEMNIPGAPPMKSSGTETVRNLGGFWIVGENKGEMMGMPFTGVMTLGYSPEKKKYIGTWFDSGNPTMWQYEGTVDEAGKVLTLHTEGPCPMQGGKIVKMKETVEFKSPDQRVFTTQMDDNGKWVTGVTITSTRKK